MRLLNSEEARNASELEPVSNSLDISKGDEAISVDGSGRETSRGKEKERNKLGILDGGTQGLI